MKEYFIRKIDHPIQLDGTLSDPIWQAAEVAQLVDCVTGNQPKLSTTFKMLYNDSYLYIGYEVEDNEIIANFTERDDPLYEEDVVELFLSPSGNLHYYYEFNFSPNSVIFDAIVLNDDGRENVGRGTLIPWKDWNCEGIKINSAKSANGNWSLTAAIPFRALHLASNKTPESGDIWRANICRIEYGDGETEYSTWSPTGLVDFHTTERFGKLRFD